MYKDPKSNLKLKKKEDKIFQKKKKKEIKSPVSQTHKPLLLSLQISAYEVLVASCESLA